MSPKAGRHEKIRESMSFGEGVGMGVGMVKRMPDVEDVFVPKWREPKYGNRVGRDLEDQAKTTKGIHTN